MAVYATDSDLFEHAPELANTGVGSWSDALIYASSDILNMIKASWWPYASSGVPSGENYDYSLTNPVLDESKINEPALKNLTCYIAMSTYIYPRLSNMVNKDGDAHIRRAEFYTKRSQEEWKIVQQLPLYDFNNDTTFTDVERKGSIVMRIKRS